MEILCYFPNHIIRWSLQNLVDCAKIFSDQMATDGITQSKIPTDLNYDTKLIIEKGPNLLYVNQHLLCEDCGNRYPIFAMNNMRFVI